MGPVRRRLFFLFGAILIVMIGVTTWASRHESLVTALPRLLRDPWAVATLFDAYFAFLTFFVWVAFRERRFVARAGWFLAIMTTGNMAMAAYVLLQLRRSGSFGLPTPAGGTQAFLPVRENEGHLD